MSNDNMKGNGSVPATTEPTLAAIIAEIDRARRAVKRAERTGRKLKHYTLAFAITPVFVADKRSRKKVDR